MTVGGDFLLTEDGDFLRSLDGRGPAGTAGLDGRMVVRIPAASCGCVRRGLERNHRWRVRGVQLWDIPNPEYGV